MTEHIVTLIACLQSMLDCGMGVDQVIFHAPAAFNAPIFTTPIGHLR